MLMRQMRQNTKIIMLVTALAFVALMVFEWGMDMSGQSAGGDLGRVGRTAVSVQAYQDTYRGIYDQIQRSQAQPISSQQDRQIEEMAWNEVVNQILIRHELARRGIRVSDEEIRDAARFSPPPEFRSDPAFLNESGQFDIARYHQFLSQAGQDPRFLQQLESYYRDVIPREKLIRQVTSGIFVSDMELWERWKAEHETVEVTVLSVTPDDRMPDSSVDVTPAEVEEYYRDNRDRFSVPARASVRYTYLSKAPSPADSAAAREFIQELYQEVLDGASFADVIQRETGDFLSRAEGGTSQAVERGSLIAPLNAAVFSLPVGELSEPIETGFGFHLVQVQSREEDRAEVDQLLVQVARTDESEIRLLTRADSLESMGIARTLDEAGQHFGLEVLQGEITEDIAILSGVGQAGEAQDWIFEDRPGAGEVSPLFETEDAFYMLEVVSYFPAGYRSLESVSTEIERDLRSRKKMDLVLEEAEEWVRGIRSGSETLEAVAERLGVELVRTQAFGRQEFVPELGQAPAAIGVAFGTRVGAVGGPLAAGNRIVLLRVEDKHEASQEDWENQRVLQRMQVTQEIQTERLDQWLDGIRETTRIVDNRAAFFRSIEEQEDGIQIPMFF